jgi:UDP-N-acetylglucosamine 2-epimerase
MHKKRKICVVITARPSYSRIRSAMQAIKENPALELQVVLAGSALLSRYGNITSTLENDGFKINEKVFMVLEGENPTTMAKTTGLGLIELSNVFYNLAPDVVVVIADRFETLSVSIAAAYQNIPVAHVQGGEITGNIDEKVRHANTKLADIHLVSSENARRRVIRLGEDPEYVFNTGCPSIDIASEILKSPELGFDPYKKYGGVGQKPPYENGYIVVMQHPVTTEYQESGADGVSHGIRAFRENHALPNMHFFKNMLPDDFLRLLYNSKCLVGNSSVGIRECSFLGVPVVNIGSRQEGRDRGENVIDIDNNEAEIKGAIDKWITNGRPARSYVYGGGDAGKKMADVLEKVTLRYHKKINF